MDHGKLYHEKDSLIGQHPSPSLALATGFGGGPRNHVCHCEQREQTYLFAFVVSVWHIHENEKKEGNHRLRRNNFFPECGSCFSHF